MKTSFMNRMAVLLLGGLFWAGGSVFAAPFDENFEQYQPDGRMIVLHGQGDEFYAVFETLDGYSVMKDEQGWYVFATPSADGTQLISTGVRVGVGAASSAGVGKHVRISPAARAAQIRVRRERDKGHQETLRKWQNLKRQNRERKIPAKGGPQATPPSSPTLGNVVTLTLLVDFPDDPSDIYGDTETATIPQEDLDALMNGDNFTKFGNAGSVKKRFFAMSNGRLVLTSLVTPYLRMPQSKRYYENPTLDRRTLVLDAIAAFKELPDFASYWTPLIQTLSTGDEGLVRGVNVLYAGKSNNSWHDEGGLWPHAWALATDVELVPEVWAWRYQMSNLGASPSIDVICHENGHLICDFPDTYDYDHDSAGGTGNFCMMKANTMNPCAYLRMHAGWVDAVTLSEGTTTIQAAESVVYKVQNSQEQNEYYLIENRQKTGWDATIPGSGIAIWHCDEFGNRDDQRFAYNANHENYEVQLMQADGFWHLNPDNAVGYRGSVITR